MNLISIFIGFGALLWALLGFVPFLGWLNWLVIPFAIIGAAIGALSSKTSGRNLNILLIIVCAVRLSIGGGLI